MQTFCQSCGTEYIPLVCARRSAELSYFVCVKCRSLYSVRYDDGLAAIVVKYLGTITDKLSDILIAAGFTVKKEE